MVQVLVVGAADQELRGGRGDRGPDVDEVQLGIVARHHPRPDVLAILERHPAPGLVARLAGSGNGAAAPQLLAGVGVVGGDDAGVGPARGHAAPARDDLAVGDDGARALGGGMGPVVQHLRLPRHAAGLGVEGEDVIVGAGVDDERAVDGDVPVVLPEGVEDVLADVVGHLAAVLPYEVAGDRVDGLDDVGGIRHVEDPVVGERRALLAPLGEGAGPHHAQVADVVAVDLVEGAVAPTVEGAAPHQPVAGRGVLQHLVGDRHEVGRRLAVRGRRRQGHDARAEGTHQENAEQAGDSAGGRRSCLHRNNSLSRRNPAGSRMVVRSPPQRLELDGPGLGEDLAALDGRPVADGVVVDQRELLGHVPVGAVGAIAGAISVTGIHPSNRRVPTRPPMPPRAPTMAPAWTSIAR